jgi:hypothetical protein
MVRAQFEGSAINLEYSSVKPTAQEPLESLFLPSRGGIFVDLDLIFEKDIVPETRELFWSATKTLAYLLFLCEVVALQLHLEFMIWFYGFASLFAYGAFDMIVF